MVEASLFGLSTTQALVVLFVLMPFALAAVVVPLVAWRNSGQPRPPLTSEILRSGEPATARVIEVRNMGTLVDLRPMVRFRLEVTVADGQPFELEVVQSLPRSMVGAFRPGQLIDVRLTADHTAGAVVWDPLS